MARQLASDDIFKALTWDDLQEWAGATIVARARAYHRDHRVHVLARTPDAGVVAWVQGTQRYATLVAISREELTSACSCPYDGVCKHAVAVVLEYLDSLKKDIEVPAVADGDRRATLARTVTVGESWGEGTEDIGDANRFGSDRSEQTAHVALRSYLKRQTKAQLVGQLEELSGRYLPVHEDLQEQRDLSMGTVAELVNSVREEIDRLSREPGWSNPWRGEGYIPDYSRVRRRLEALLARGHADQVVALGEDLLAAGATQVEMTHDEGETAEEIRTCLDVVFRALAQSSLSPAEQMLWVVEAELRDEYDLCEGTESFWEQERAEVDWDALAEKLLQRLNRLGSGKGEDADLGRYRRDLLTDRLIVALHNARRHDETIPLCEREAEATGSYVRLVNRLMAANRLHEAEHWIHKGVEATEKEWPGIASQLRDALRTMREEEGDWLRAAAYRAEDFFLQPTLATYKELQVAAERAAVWPAARAAAMHYLATGQLPRAEERAAGDAIIPPWPLPESDMPESVQRHQTDAPMTGTLIDIAIAENRPGEVVHWYDQRRLEPTGWGRTWFQQDEIAEAVADAYPDRAVAVWKALAESEIARTETRAYEMAAGHLRKIRRVLRNLGRESEWEEVLAELRQANARKRRLIEILDTLRGRPIIEGP